MWELVVKGLGLYVVMAIVSAITAFAGSTVLGVILSGFLYIAFVVLMSTQLVMLVSSLERSLHGRASKCRPFPSSVSYTFPSFFVPLSFINHQWCRFATHK